MSSIVYNYPEYPEDEKGIHPSLRPQRASLITKEAPTKVSIEYADFIDVFSPDLTSELPEHIKTKDCAIELVDVNGFIRLSKSPADAPIFFDRESDGLFCLRVNYRDFNNLIKS